MVMLKQFFFLFQSITSIENNFSVMFAMVIIRRASIALACWLARRSMTCATSAKATVSLVATARVCRLARRATTAAMCAAAT